MGRKPPGFTAMLLAMCAVVLVSGCRERPSSSLASEIRAPGPGVTKPHGTALRLRSLDFVQDGLHNCGTIAMLISWAKTHQQDAASLVWRQPDGSYLVAFRGAESVRVTADDLKAGTKSRLVRTRQGDEWARIVLTAFTKLKCGQGRLDFRVADWVYAGEIASCLTGAQTGVFEIKQETLDAKGRPQVGRPVPLSALKEKLNTLRGKPLVAYTNRRVHIWAVMAYDPAKLRVLVRNPRLQNSSWLSIGQFSQRFQLLVYTES